MRHLVLTHIDKLLLLTRNFPFPPWIIVAVESNLGLEAAHVAHLLKSYPRCVMLHETGPEGRFGVLTTHQRKLEFVAVLEDLLLQDAVNICDKVVSQDVTGCIKTLQKQMENYRMLTNEIGRGNVFGAVKVTYSGKVTSDGKVASGALQDDLCIALQMAAFWSSYVIQRKCIFLDYNKIFK